MPRTDHSPIAPPDDRTDAARPAGPPGAVTVRPARPGDARSAWEVERAAFAEPDRFSLRQTAGLIANPRARVFVADSEGEVVGWIAMLTRRGRSGPAGRLYTVAVSPQAAGRGLGRLLTTHAVESLGAEGVHRIYLEVRQDNHRAIALYESMGFRVVRRLPGYYADGAAAYRMVRRRPPPGAEAAPARPPDPTHGPDSGGSPDVISP